MKLLLTFGLLFVIIAVMAAQDQRAADASVAGPLVASATQMNSGGTPITVTVPVEAPHSPVDISVATESGSVSGTMVVIACTPDCPLDLGKSTGVDALDPITVDTAGLSQIVVALGLTCSSDAAARVTATTGMNDTQSVRIDCLAVGTAPGAPTGQGGSVALIPGVGQFVVSASPNVLPCEGGTTTITAEVIEQFGVPLHAFEVRFRITEGNGNLVQTSRTTASLTLGPNQVRAAVTATLYFEVNGRSGVVSATTPIVELRCNPNLSNQTLVVTASPNVIECTGTTTITATVRDENGHVVPGRGFHFVTSAGILEVHPNNAHTEEGKATLTLRPGDGDATVIASSGPLFGTYEELREVEQHFGDETDFVTVQQRCLSTATGMVRVNSSAKDIVCGESVFIGLDVIDEDVQTVVDGTTITLIASHGGFFASGSEMSPAVQVPTTRGQANTIYTAPKNFHGEVRITAASGAVYGYTRLNVHCYATAAAGPGPAAPEPCIPIGDGICIAPPSTGANRITPPSTGSAGLR